MSNEIRNCIMVDLETMSSKRDAAVLTIGAVRFNDLNMDVEPEGLYLKINPEDAIKNGSVSKETMEWWEKQPKEIFKEAFSGKLSTENAMRQLFDFFNPNVKYVWSKGNFDLPIIEYHWEKIGITPPYKWWDVCEYRTLQKFIDPMLEGVNSHNALEDAIAQAEGVQNIMRQLMDKNILKSRKRF